MENVLLKGDARNKETSIDMPPSDLRQIDNGLDGLHSRLIEVRHRLENLYGQGDELKARPAAGGVIPSIQATIEDMSETVARIEAVINRM